MVKQMLDNLIRECPEIQRSLMYQGFGPKLGPAFNPKQIKAYLL
jgi:hypothetical protein